jgi:hypothetical protein
MFPSTLYLGNRRRRLRKKNGSLQAVVIGVVIGATKGPGAANRKQNRQNHCPEDLLWRYENWWATIIDTHSR